MEAMRCCFSSWLLGCSRAYLRAIGQHRDDKVILALVEALEYLGLNRSDIPPFSHDDRDILSVLDIRLIRTTSQ